MGLRPDDFNALTPAEFIYAWIGWSELEQNRTKQAWERKRWSVWVATCIQLDKKDRQPMTQMFPLPWEEVVSIQQELTMEERKKRVNDILNK
jgi:hypothetical protein